MAAVDFTNAVLEPYTLNPASAAYLSTYAQYLYNSGGSVITSSCTPRILSNTVNELVMQITGTFNASGSEFYFRTSGNVYWRMSNITFASGDTFDFQINADLITT